MTVATVLSRGLVDASTTTNLLITNRQSLPGWPQHEGLSGAPDLETDGSDSLYIPTTVAAFDNRLTCVLDRAQGCDKD